MMRQSICALPIGYRVSYSYGYENRVLLASTWSHNRYELNARKTTIFTIIFLQLNDATVNMRTAMLDVIKFNCSIIDVVNVTYMHGLTV
jgi:hypothetical protein